MRAHAHTRTRAERVDLRSKRATAPGESWELSALEAEGRAARSTVVAAGLCMVLIALVWGVGCYVLCPEPAARAGFSLLVGAAALGCTALAVWRSPAAGAGGLVLVAWLGVTTPLVMRGSLDTPPVGGLMVVLVLAALLLRGRGALLAGALVVTSGLLVHLRETLHVPLLVLPQSTAELPALYAASVLLLTLVGVQMLRSSRGRERHARQRAGLLGALRQELELEGPLDVSEQLREVRERMAEQNRFALIGRMAAGVTHDFRNLLMIVKGELELACVDADEGIHNAFSASTRAAETAERVLQLVRGDAAQRAPIDLRAMVLDFEGLLGAALPTGVRVEMDTGARGVWIEGSETQLTQVVLNLSLNGAAAMPDGGVLRLQVARGSAAASHAVIEVGDTGSGMSADVAGRIFDPLYSTKSPQEGSGLGMTIVQHIVTAHGGRVRVESESGKGTTMRVELPLLPEEAHVSKHSVGFEEGAAKCCVVRARGELSDGVIRDLIGQLDGLEGVRASDALYDYRGVTEVGDLSAETARALLEIRTRNGEAEQAKKIAIVASHRTLWNLGKRFQALSAERLPGVRIFREIGPARAYLGLPKQPPGA